MSSSGASRSSWQSSSEWATGSSYNESEWSKDWSSSSSTFTEVDGPAVLPRMPTYVDSDFDLGGGGSSGDDKPQPKRRLVLYDPCDLELAARDTLEDHLPLREVDDILNMLLEPTVAGSFLGSWVVNGDAIEEGQLLVAASAPREDDAEEEYGHLSLPEAAESEDADDEMGGGFSSEDEETDDEDEAEERTGRGLGYFVRKQQFVFTREDVLMDDPSVDQPRNSIHCDIFTTLGHPEGGDSMSFDSLHLEVFYGPLGPILRGQGSCFFLVATDAFSYPPPCQFSFSRPAPPEERLAGTLSFENFGLSIAWNYLLSREKVTRA